MKTEWPYAALIAHRAGGTVAPENTLAAIRLAGDLRYRVVEVDVRFSRDDVAVLQHDDRIDRNTNGSGSIAASDWAALAKLDAGSWRGDAYRGEPMARLEEAARLLRSLRIAPHVEIKRIEGQERARGGRVAAQVAALWEGAVERPLLISFSPEALEGARAAAPSLDRGYIAEAPFDGDLAPLERTGAVSLHLQHELITRDLVERVHAGGRRLLAWTVNEIGDAERLLEWGVDGIVTDNVRGMAERFPHLL